MRLITHKSKKIFYKKYLYKISFSLVVGDIFRSYYQKKNFDYTENRIREYEKELTTKSFIEKGVYRKYKFGIEEVNDAKILKTTLMTADDYMIRSEDNHTIVIYTNDKDVFLNCIKNMTTIHIVEIYAPDDSVKNSLLSDPTTLVSKFAKDYEYKVTINIGALRRSNSSLLTWIAANRNKIKISDYALTRAYSFVGAYVRDQKVLLLLQMSDQNHITKIERLISPS